MRPGQTNINHRQMQINIACRAQVKWSNILKAIYTQKICLQFKIWNHYSLYRQTLFTATASCRQNVGSQFPAPDFIMRLTARWLLGITITRVSRYLSRLTNCSGRRYDVTCCPQQEQWARHISIHHNSSWKNRNVAHTSPSPPVDTSISHLRTVRLDVRLSWFTSCV